jgi:hypothetical protein
MNLIKLAEQAGLRPRYVASTEGGEYHSPCPLCGGKDRFIMHSNKKMDKCVGSYFCRRCGKNGDSIQFCREFLGIHDFREAAEYAGAVLEEKDWCGSVAFLFPKFNGTFLDLPPKAWIERARNLVEEAQANILQQLGVLDNLRQRGLPIDAVKEYKIGWVPVEKHEKGLSWGLKPEDKIWLSEGILVPSIERDGTVVRLKIRRKNWRYADKLPKYAAVTGSMKGLTVIGDRKKPVLIVVESELDAYAVHYAAKDFACVIAIGGSTKNPDPLTDDLVRKKKHVLFCHDNDEVGKEVLQKWQNFYTHVRAYPTPIGKGKDIGEAIHQGLNLRAWLIDALPEDFQTILQGVKSCWSKEDLYILNWFSEYLDKRSTATISMRHLYANFEREIALGPDSPRAKTGELQDGLWLMKEMLEQ